MQYFHSLRGHRGRVSALASYGAHFVVSGASDGAVRFWKTETRKCLQELHTEEDLNRGKLSNPCSSTALRWACLGLGSWDKNETLFVNRKDGMLICFDIRNGTRINRINTKALSFAKMKISDVGKILTPYGKNSVAVFEATFRDSCEAPVAQISFGGAKGLVMAVEVNGEYGIAACFESRDIVSWDLRKTEVPSANYVLPGGSVEKKAVPPIDLSWKENRMWIGTANGDIFLNDDLNSEFFREIYSCSGRGTGSVTELHNSKVFVGGWEGQCGILTEEGQMHVLPDVHFDSVNDSIALDDLVYAGSSDRTISVWAVQ